MNVNLSYSFKICMNLFMTFLSLYIISIGGFKYLYQSNPNSFKLLKLHNELGISWNSFDANEK